MLRKFEEIYIKCGVLKLLLLFFVYKSTNFYFILELNDVFIYLSRIEHISMQMPKKFIITTLLLFAFSNNALAQFGFSHEVGVIVGPVAFQSDYGERHDFSTNAGNTGYGIGLIHYLNFSYRADCNCYTPETYFNDHFRLRGSVSSNAKLRI